jgi:3-deoxy-D-manno-octulosonic acid (KDO) 8-phosphate synthase
MLLLVHLRDSTVPVR